MPLGALEGSQAELGRALGEENVHERRIHPSSNFRNARPPETSTAHKSLIITAHLEAPAHAVQGLELGTQTGTTSSSNSQPQYANSSTLEAGAATGVGVPVATVACTPVEPCAGDPSAGEPAMSDQFVAECWGCGQQVSLPVYTSVFRCGHCGALSYDYEVTGAPAESQQRKQRRRGWVKFRDRLTVVLVLLLISVVITGGGVWSSFPVLFHSLSLPFLLTITATALLYLNTVFNFLCCSCLPAGPVEPVPWGDVSSVPAGSLTDYTLCSQCTPSRPKPSRAHHCRQCGDCVLDMDHHCPFIGNCVGQSNQRHFMVFLLFATLSCAFAIAVCLTAFLRLLTTLDFSFAQKIAAEFGRTGTAQALLSALPRLLVALIYGLSFRGAVLLYLMAVSIGTTTCTAVLLYQQLSLIFHGLTYIDSLKQIKAKGRGATPASSSSSSHAHGVPYRNGDRDGGRESERLLDAKGPSWGGEMSLWEQRMMLLRNVFGSGPVWSWLLPRIQPPPGSRSYKQHDS